MSSKAGKMAKKVKLSQLNFAPDMYTNLYGSVVICGYIFSEESKKPSVSHLNALWLRAKDNPDEISWTLEDEAFVDKTLAYFGMERPKVFPVAFVQGRLNCLFAPYVNGEILPLREDGLMTQTLRKGKIYPVEFNVNDEEVKHD